MKTLMYMFLVLVLLIASVCSAANITLRWDANTETDLAGYELHYKMDTPGEPYDGTGATEGNSPVDIPLSILVDVNNPEFTITNLDAGHIYFLALKAYDTTANYSGLSNEVTSFYISSPMNGFLINSTNYTAFNVHGRAAAFIDVDIYSNNVLIGTTTPDTNGAWSIDIDFSGVSQGIINIHAETNASPLPTGSVVGTLDYTAPLPPTITQSLVVTSVTQTEVGLSWDDVPDTTGYVVYRNGANISQTPNNQYTDVGLTPATTYEYEVSTVDNLSIKSNLESATTLPDSSPPPSGGRGGGSSSGCFINSIK